MELGKKVKLILITLLFQLKTASFQCSKTLAIKNRLLSLKRTWILRFALEKLIFVCPLSDGKALWHWTASSQTPHLETLKHFNKCSSSFKQSLISEDQVETLH